MAVFPVRVLIDTREQLGYGFTVVPDDQDPDDATGDYTPYTFAGIAADKAEGGRLIEVTTEVRTLPSGDYSLDGYETRLSIERKSVSDLFRTISAERGRFIRELERLSEYDFAAIVVEAEWSEILAGPPRHSKLQPRTVHRSVTAWEQRYPRVHWRFMPGRAAAEVTTFRILHRFWQDREASKPRE